MLIKETEELKKIVAEEKKTEDKAGAVEELFKKAPKNDNK